MSTLHIALAYDAAEFLAWCSKLKVASSPIAYSVVGQRKDKIRQVLVGIKEYNLILFPRWQDKEYVDIDYCNGLILFASILCPLDSVYPKVKNGEIRRWLAQTEEEVDRQKYMLKAKSDVELP